MSLLVVIGCPSAPWLVQAFTWVGGVVCLLVVCALFVAALERVQDAVRVRSEEDR